MNQDRKKVLVETKKDKLLPNISTSYLTELNGLTYVGAKLVCYKSDVSLSNPKGNTKPKWEIRLEGEVKKLRQAKML